MISRLSIHNTFTRMKKNVFLFVVMLNSLALIGIIFVQFFWIRQAFDLLEDQFDGSVRVALKAVVNQIHDYESLKANEYGENPEEMISFQPDVRELNLFVVQYKLSEEFRRMNITENYEFAVFDRRDSSILIGKYDHHINKILASPHQIELVGFKNAEFYFLTAWFPGERRIFFREIMVGLADEFHVWDHALAAGFQLLDQVLPIVGVVCVRQGIEGVQETSRPGVIAGEGEFPQVFISDDLGCFTPGALFNDHLDIAGVSQQRFREYRDAALR